MQSYATKSIHSSFSNITMLSASVALPDSNRRNNKDIDPAPKGLDGRRNQLAVVRMRRPCNTKTIFVSFFSALSNTTSPHQPGASKPLPDTLGGNSDSGYSMLALLIWKHTSGAVYYVPKRC